jgi:hypothetical protein
MHATGKAGASYSFKLSTGTGCATIMRYAAAAA